MTRLVLLLAPLLFIPRLVVVLPPQEPLGSRVLFVVDASGSMKGPEFARALEAVRTIAGQPTDSMEFAVLAFNDSVYRWEGIPDEHTPRGWAALPSHDAVQHASDWLGRLGASGDTLVIPALRTALAEERPKLSLVLVTDGYFHTDSEQIVTAIREAQERRRKQELGLAVILVYGVGSKTKALQHVAGEASGGYFQETSPSVPPPPVPPPVIQGYRNG
jgi:hypothetical protein